MTRAQIMQDIRTRFKDDIVNIFERSPEKVYIEIHAQALRKIAEYVFKGLQARFNTLTGIDGREHMELLYHFTFDRLNLYVSFRIRLEKINPEIESLAPLFEGANWVERETREVLGINFQGHPDLRRLLLPEDWPSGVYPLRQDYKEWDKGAIRDRGV